MGSLEHGEAVVEVGPLCIDGSARRVTLNGQAVELTRKEYAVLWLLARYPGWLIIQQQLLTDVWGPSNGDKIHYVRIVVGHLRRKLNDSAAVPRFILTEPGVGYRLADG